MITRVASCLVVLFASHLLAQEPGPIGLPAMNLSVPDRVILLAIDDASLPLRRRLNLYVSRPAVHPVPVLEPSRERLDAPDRLGAYFYGSVIHEPDGRFRMWYYAMHDPSFDSNTLGPICYAESRDGFTWTKPALRQVAFEGSYENNVVALPDRATTGVFVIRDDADPDPARRYKMAYNARHPTHSWSVRTGTSADGIRWTFSESLVIDEFVEVGSLYAFGGRYFINGQTFAYGEGGRPRGRQAYAWMSPDFTRWVQARAESFALPEPAGLSGSIRDPWRVQFDQVHLGVGARAYPNVLVGLYARWRERGWGAGGTSADFGLVVSNDGPRFREPVKGHIFLAAADSPAPPLADADFPTILCQGNGILNVGDRTFLYHGRWRNSEWPPKAPLRRHSEIAVATLPRDRWGALGLGPDQTDGEVWSTPIVLPAGTSQLFLNAEEAAGLRVDLADADFRPLDTFSGDRGGTAGAASGLDLPVRFADGDLRSLAGRTVRLRVRFARTGGASPRLFAITIARDGAAPHD